MVLESHESGEKIVNPFVAVLGFHYRGGAVESPVKGLESPIYDVYVNSTETGGLQKELIHSLNHRSHLHTAPDGESLYELWGVVGEYTHPDESGLLSVDGTRRQRSRTFIGYVRESILKRELPKTFELFERERSLVIDESELVAR